MKVIELTKGYVAWVDDEDAELGLVRWCATVRKGGRVYAVRNTARNKSEYMHRRIMGYPSANVDHVVHLATPA